MAKPRKLPPSADDIKLINTEHQAVVGASAGALNHAIACGEMLKAAKGKVKHGEWEQWLLDNCPDISDRTARSYMWCAGKAPELEKTAEQNGTDAADFSIRGMRKLLAKPRAPAQTAARAPKAAVPAPAPSVSTSCGPMLYHLSCNSAPDDVFEFLTDVWDEDQLAQLTNLLMKRAEVEEETEEEDATAPIREPKLERATKEHVS